MRVALPLDLPRLGILCLDHAGGPCSLALIAHGMVGMVDTHDGNRDGVTPGALSKLLHLLLQILVDALVLLDHGLVEDLALAANLNSGDDPTANEVLGILRYCLTGNQFPERTVSPACANPVALICLIDDAAFRLNALLQLRRFFEREQVLEQLDANEVVLDGVSMQVRLPLEEAGECV